MKFRNDEEFTALGKVAIGLGMVAGMGALGSMVAFAPPSEIELAREAHTVHKAQQEKKQQEILAREYSRRLNGG